MQKMFWLNTVKSGFLRSVYFLLSDLSFRFILNTGLGVLSPPGSIGDVPTQRVFSPPLAQFVLQRV